MALKLMFITNKPEIASIAEKSGVDWIFVDLEVEGKRERQVHTDGFISDHKITDVSIIGREISKAELVVRINPFSGNTKREVEKVIRDGADIVMLPYFKNIDEISNFIDYVDSKAKVCLLLETKESFEMVDEIIKLDGIDYIHVGLNDLHLSYDMDFMFEPLSNGMMDQISEKIRDAGITFGFGGIAKIGSGDLKAEHILSEHIRLKSSMVILSRSFFSQDKLSAENADDFSKEVEKLREYELDLMNADYSTLLQNKEILIDSVEKIVKRKKQ